MTHRSDSLSILRLGGKANPSPCSELSVDQRFLRTTSRHDIVQDAINNLFVEAAGVAIRSEIEFQRFRFNAPITWHVFYRDFGEIRLTRHWAKRCEIGAFKFDQITPLCVLIFESLNGLI